MNFLYDLKRRDTLQDTIQAVEQSDCHKCSWTENHGRVFPLGKVSPSGLLVPASLYALEPSVTTSSSCCMLLVSTALNMPGTRLQTWPGYSHHHHHLLITDS